MRRTAYVMGGAWLVALLVAAGGLVYQHLAAEQLSRARVECEQENARVALRTTPRHHEDVTNFQDIGYDCSIGYTYKPYDSPTVERIRVLAGRANDSTALSVAVSIAFLGSLPFVFSWFWYFLLRRLSEVAEALRGRQP